MTSVHCSQHTSGDSSKHWILCSICLAGAVQRLTHALQSISRTSAVSFLSWLNFGNAFFQVLVYNYALFVSRFLSDISLCTFFTTVQVGNSAHSV
jgi:hypothetical protein